MVVVAGGQDWDSLVLGVLLPPSLLAENIPPGILRVSHHCRRLLSSMILRLLLGGTEPEAAVSALPTLRVWTAALRHQLN